MNQPRDALLQRFMREAQPSVRRLREAGWPVEVVVYRDSPVEGEGTFGVKIVCRLDYIPEPVETQAPLQEGAVS